MKTDTSCGGFHLTAIHEILDAGARDVPDKPALTTDDGALTYADLVDHSKRLASWLRSQGVRRGDRVALVLPNGAPAVTALFAASRIGAVFFIVNPATKWYHLEHILNDAAPALIISTQSHEQKDDMGRIAPLVIVEEGWEAALATPPLDEPMAVISSDTACLIYTSGSTGKPKAVISSHRNMLFAAWAIQQCLQMEASDVVGVFLPLSFDYGLYQVFLTLQARATIALGRESHVGPSLLKTLDAWKVTALPLVPNMASILIRLAKRNAQALPRLRMITNTGAHLPRTYIDDMRMLFPDSLIFVMFGLTECKRVSILQPAEYAAKSDSVGKPLPNTECLIVDTEGRLLPPGEIGELVVRGPHVMPGYWRAPELTALRFRPWAGTLENALFTGDMAHMDADGYLYFHGRNDDIFKQTGYRVSASEIEAAACDITGVHQAAVIPPAEALGSALFVTSELSEDTLREELRQRLEDYKMPSQIFVIDEFPLTTNGKTDKARLKSYMTGAAKS